MTCCRCQWRGVEISNVDLHQSNRESFPGWKDSRFWKRWRHARLVHNSRWTRRTQLFDGRRVCSQFEGKYLPLIIKLLFQWSDSGLKVWLWLKECCRNSDNVSDKHCCMSEKFTKAKHWEPVKHGHDKWKLTNLLTVTSKVKLMTWYFQEINSPRYAASGKNFTKCNQTQRFNRMKNFTFLGYPVVPWVGCRLLAVFFGNFPVTDRNVFEVTAKIKSIRFKIQSNE